MIEIIDIPIPKSLQALPEMISAVIPDIADAVRNHIVDRAERELHSSEQDYVAGIQPVKLHFPGKIPMTGPVVVATITLVGMLPNMIENGWPGGDMKQYLLFGRNAKIGKDGKPYNTVPFRQGTPGVTGRNFKAMGEAYAEKMGMDAARKLGREVFKKAKRLKPGERLPEGLGPRLREHHVTDLFAGMIRQRGPGRSTQYMTFRRVSTKSDPRAWVHPGIVGRHLFRDASKYANQAAARIFQEVLRG